MEVLWLWASIEECEAELVTEPFEVSSACWTGASEEGSLLVWVVVSLVAGMPLHAKDEEEGDDGLRCWVVRIVTGP